MKKFIKENFVLVVGLTLPLFLIVFFFLATVVPKAMSTPPQYEMIFTTVGYQYQASPDFSLDFTVKDKRIMVKAKKLDEKNRQYNLKRLMTYNPATEVMREISVDVDKLGEVASNAAIVLDETKDILIDPSSISPDGYKLERMQGGRGFMMGMFGGGYKNGNYRLKKGGIAFKVIDNESNSSYNQNKLLGWVVKK